jgi:hypothetical protein
MNTHPPALEEFLSGGDLRSTGTADQAAGALLSGHWTPEDFLRLIEKATSVVRMRAADALERATRTEPELIRTSASRLLALLAAPQPKEVRWHLLQMAPRIDWETLQQYAVLAAVKSAFDDPSAIVQTSALQALADLSGQAKSFAVAFRRQLPRALASRLPSLRARARKLANRNGA